MVVVSGHYTIHHWTSCHFTNLGVKTFGICETVWLGSPIGLLQIKLGRASLVKCETGLNQCQAECKVLALSELQ